MVGQGSIQPVLDQSRDNSFLMNIGGAAGGEAGHFSRSKVTAWGRPGCAGAGLIGVVPGRAIGVRAVAFDPGGGDAMNVDGLIDLVIGLENIKARYKYLSDLPVEITEESGSFIVSIPILTMNK